VGGSNWKGGWHQLEKCSHRKAEPNAFFPTR